MNRAVVALGAILLSSHAEAQMSERQMRAAINVQAELMQCSAYFALVGACLDRSGVSGAQLSTISADM